MPSNADCVYSGYCEDDMPGIEDGVSKTSSMPYGELGITCDAFRRLVRRVGFFEQSDTRILSYPIPP